MDSNIDRFRFKGFQESSWNSESAVDDALRQHNLRRDYLAIRSLVDRGAYLDVEDYNQGTPLSLESRNGRLEAVRLLLEHGEDVDHQDSTGWTPLHEASAQGHHDVVQLLLEHDAELEAQTTSLWTPLHIASLKGKLVGLLLSHEADVLARNNEDQTFLDVAWANGHTEMFDVDSLYTGDRTVLHIAAQHGDPKFMRWLIDRGAKTDAEDKNMETPLFPASRNGRLGATQLLLDHQAKVNHRNWKKRTPLHGALGNGHLGVSMLLLHHDADVNAQNVYNWTPLHLASQMGMKIVTKELIERRANVNARNDFGWTPLHMAAQKGHVEIVKVLLVSDADVKIQNEDGETALHLSAYYGKPGVGEVLLKRDADLLHILNSEGKTPLDLALQEGHKDLAQTLRRAVENPAAIGSEGDSRKVCYISNIDRPNLIRSILFCFIRSPVAQDHANHHQNSRNLLHCLTQRSRATPLTYDLVRNPGTLFIHQVPVSFIYLVPGACKWPCISRLIKPRGFPVAMSRAYSGGTYQSPYQAQAHAQAYQPSELPLPVRRSPHPRTSQPPPPVPQCTHSATAPTRPRTSVDENASSTPPPPSQPLSRSSSHNPTFPMPLRQEKHAHTDFSGSLLPMAQRSTYIPIPNNPRIAATAHSGAYHDSSRSETLAEPLPMERNRRYRTCFSLIYPTTLA